MNTCAYVYVSEHVCEGLYEKPCVLLGHDRIHSGVWDSVVQDPCIGT